jgi:hypothetical protein
MMIENEIKRQRSTDERFNEYVRNCKKQPRSFGDWLRITNMYIHHRQIIRPMIIWWQELRKRDLN